VKPLLRGWGGSRIHESDEYNEEWSTWETPKRTEPSSEVFSGEVASDLEMTVRLLVQTGYNAIRTTFDGPPSYSESVAGSQWQWNEGYFQRALQICKHYGIWMIPCYAGHGSDPYMHTMEWVNFWRHIVETYGPLYDKLVWEPCNEPLTMLSDGTGQLQGIDAVNETGREYQLWIDMARSVGDTHWILVSVTCWWNELPPEDWWTEVVDPLDRIFYGRHHYYYWADHSHEWNVDAAKVQADRDFQIDAMALTKYSRPFLNTEFGPTLEGAIVPDAVEVNGYLAYSITTLAYVTRLIEHYKTRTNMSYTLYPCSDVYPPSLYGDMKVWGKLVPTPDLPTPMSPLGWLLPIGIGAFLLSKGRKSKRRG